MCYTDILKVKDCWKLRSAKLLLIYPIFLSAKVWGQYSDERSDFNTASYLFPIKPGSPASLAGTMGELRSTHFHTGIDIRTNNEIGWPVRAAADGYVSRATVSPTGFGLALYVKHSNGHTTVYGHLDRFRSDIHDYVKSERYRRQTSSIDLHFRKDQFPVRKGDTIAFSGNTGSSAGPHLHFDIRDEENQALDPALFRFVEIIDKQAPVVRKIALRTLSLHARVNDEFGRQEFYVTRSGNTYRLNEPIMAWGEIGLELWAYDIVDHPAYKCGVNYMEVTIDSQRIFSQAINRLNLNEGRQVLTASNYAAYRESGNLFYKLYVDHGNNLPFYQAINRGVIPVYGDKPIPVQVKLADAHQNTTFLHFTLIPSPPPVSVAWLAPVKEVTWTVDRYIWKITSPTCAWNALRWSGGQPEVVDVAYLNEQSSVYLIDLRQPLPDSFTICRKYILPPIKAIIPPRKEMSWHSEGVEIRFNRLSLFDTLYLPFSRQLKPDSSEWFIIGNTNEPLRGSVQISLVPARSIPQPEKTSVYRLQGKSFNYVGGKWDSGQIVFSTREWGTFTLLTDTIPPVITPIQVNRNEIRLRIRDNLSGIHSFTATLDGQWLLMNYDEKTRTLLAEPADPKKPMKGLLKVLVTDQAGNEMIFKQQIL